MIDTEERITPPVAAVAGETGKPKPKPFGALRYLLCVLALAATCAFAISQSGILNLVRADAADSGLININTASVVELKELPDINKKIADAIISERPFKSIDDLLKVKGIGEKKLEKIRDFITVE